MKTKKRLKKISLIVLLISIVLLAILIVYAQGLRLILIKPQTQKDYPTGCESGIFLQQQRTGKQYTIHYIIEI